MKHWIWIFLPLLLWEPQHLWGDTDPQTVDFIKKVSQNYYAVDGPGIKKFAARVTIQPSPALEQYLRSLPGGDQPVEAMKAASFAVTVFPGDGKDNHIESSALPSDPQGRKALQMLQNEILTAGSLWAQFSLGPAFNPDDFKPANSFEVYPATNGFTIQFQFAGGSTNAFYDKKSKLLEVRIKGDQGTLVVKPEFQWTEKGYVLMAAWLGNANFRYTYQVLGGFWVPSTVVSHPRVQAKMDNQGKVLEPGVLKEDQYFTYQFTNCQFLP
jgi:hypothetical protein